MSRVVTLTGGVGGAKLVLGLMQICPPEQITAIVNTGDDFRHLGLAISPDIDTLLYTLSGKANKTQGWGREGESWSFMDAVKSLGGEDWFLLGDGDLALHVLRSHLLAEGETLSAITARFASAWELGLSILPMSDDPVATHLTTSEGDMPFQRYFVECRCAPEVEAIRFEGAERASATAGVIEAITDPATKAILIAPSNPWLSVDPILAVPGIKEALAVTHAPVVAVSPIVGGQAVKGPTAKLMGEMGLAVTNESIAAHYADIIDGLLVDERDDASGLTIPHDVTDTLMKTLADRERVARAALALADRIAG
ncbi:2-phospho-L-lactate transferase [Sphingomonadales bacterium 56]|uniref:2-phospho-L-lactate transferase n=1 Tax=unclassified Sphingobium TaxID=2611147 RepID=UPI001917B0FA|nr:MULTISPECIES: 2-phospho-L-lactate transferase [unclassified Sphingobium]MBY2929059.1 2-phospho-L-lactate transferase [Sphingomonadales bacterium 56]MBY2959089.1 2-phospho-L-lactate transferase [Sphingomonadales bacterium 58]CAD7338401.1 Phosphoenolpyruvate transferase [Sphingobium sp. S6]CAD7338568.1 Phosphoenolpyruvate transferase [Sphingobium sp. S8]